MDHDAASDQFADCQVLQFGTQTRITLCIGDKVRHVAAVPDLAVMMTMTLASRVVMALGATGISGAAIASLMDMKTVLTWRQASKLGIDLNSTAKIAESNVT